MNKSTNRKKLESIALKVEERYNHYCVNDGYYIKMVLKKNTNQSKEYLLFIQPQYSKNPKRKMILAPLPSYNKGWPITELTKPEEMVDEIHNILWDMEEFTPLVF